MKEQEKVTESPARIVWFMGSVSTASGTGGGGGGGGGRKEIQVIYCKQVRRERNKEGGEGGGERRDRETTYSEQSLWQKQMHCQ